jgi:hypothetical protein
LLQLHLRRRLPNLHARWLILFEHVLRLNSFPSEMNLSFALILNLLLLSLRPPLLSNIWGLTINMSINSFSLRAEVTKSVCR